MSEKLNLPHLTLDKDFNIIYIDPAIEKDNPCYLNKNFFKNILLGYDFARQEGPFEFKYAPFGDEMIQFVFCKNDENLDCIPVKVSDYGCTDWHDNSEYLIWKPVTSIFAGLNSFADDLSKPAMDYRRAIRHVEDMYKYTYQMYRQMDNVTTATNILSGNIDEPITIDLSEMLKETEHALSFYGDISHLDMEIEDNILIKSDPRIMISGIANIILNSIVYRGDANVAIKIKLKKTGNNALFIYSDNSKGIKDEFLPHIFKPYFSKDPYNDGEKDPSLGLGLFIAKSAFDIAGGNMLVSSKFGDDTGVTYTVSIPLAEDNGCVFRSFVQETFDSRFGELHIQLSDIKDFKLR